MQICRLAILVAAVACLRTLIVFGDVPVPSLKAHVTDMTGTLNASDHNALETKLADFEHRSGSQIAVLLVPTTQPETIEQYGIRVGDAWKIGRKNVDDGVILIVAKDDHRLRIEVGYGLETALTDVTTKRIISEVITPRFKQRDFYRGIDEGVDAVMMVVSGEALPVPTAGKPAIKHGRPGYEWEWPTTPKDVAILVGVSLLTMLTILSTSAGLSAATGAFIAALVCSIPVAFASRLFTADVPMNILVGLVCFFECFLFSRYLAKLSPHVVIGNGSSPKSERNRSRDSGWSSSGSGSSSSSSSDSGYSGGGGSFGGGGASGSW